MLKGEKENSRGNGSNSNRNENQKRKDDTMSNTEKNNTLMIEDICKFAGDRDIANIEILEQGMAVVKFTNGEKFEVSKFGLYFRKIA